MSEALSRRFRVERRLTMVGLLLLVLMLAGLAAWMTLSGRGCADTATGWACSEDGRFQRSLATVASYAAMGFGALCILWVGFILSYGFHTNRLRAASDAGLHSHVDDNHPSDVPQHPSSVSKPSWRSGQKAILVIFGSLAAISLAVFVYAFIRYRQSLMDPQDYWRDEGWFQWSFFALVCFLACGVIVVRDRAIRRSDLTQGERIHRIQALSSADALAALRAPSRAEGPRMSSCRAAVGRAIRLLNRGPKDRSPRTPVKVPSAEALRALYTRERMMRLTAYGLMILAILVGLLSESIYNSAECVAYYRWSCVQLDPEAVTLSHVVGVLCLLTFIAAAAFWWRALSLQTYTKTTEARLAGIERTRDGAKGWYPLDGLTNNAKGHESEGAREGS